MTWLLSDICRLLTLVIEADILVGTRPSDGNYGFLMDVKYFL